jgi:hypothetical protein
MLLALKTLEVLAMASLAIAIPFGDLADRGDGGGCGHSTIQQTIVVGDGNPHQNFLYKQVSGVTDCDGNPGGSAAVTQTLTVSHGISLGASVDFITGGFDVSVSTSTGFTNSFGCGTPGGGSEPGSLCVFERIQLTAYTVNTQTCVIGYGACGGEETCTPNTSPNSVLYAPNSIQGSCFYDNFQLNLPCGVLGTEHRFDSGPAGGPQFISCEDPTVPRG